MVCDQWAVQTIKSYFPKQKELEEGEKEEGEPEEIDMCYSFQEVEIGPSQTVYNHVMIVMSTHQNLYVFQKNYDYWMPDDEDENQYFLTPISEFSDGPVKMSTEWRIYPKVPGEEDPDAKPRVEIREKPDGGKASKGRTKLGAMVIGVSFSSYITCQTYWQGIRYAQALASGKKSDGKMTDISGTDGQL